MQVFSLGSRYPWKCPFFAREARILRAKGVPLAAAGPGHRAEAVPSQRGCFAGLASVNCSQLCLLPSHWSLAEVREGLCPS